ncbi:chloride channel protein [Candidatus Micrarchaeota archaeon]|nr:chloride channel protein [Candidatus Micrarchaeota archaeon]
MRKLTEQTILIFSVAKWVFLAAIVGLIVGSATTMFLKALETAMVYVQQFPHYYFILPVALAFTVIFIQKVAPKASGHGTERVIEAVHEDSGHISAAIAPVKMLASIITVAAGGSAGREGPAAQAGAALASTLARWARFDPADQRKLVICGISAGFAAVFGTPVAGAIFGVEVLVVGGLLYDVLLPSLVAGIVAYGTASGFGIHYFRHALSLSPTIDFQLLAYAALAGVFFGVCAMWIIEVLQTGQSLVKRIKAKAVYKAFGAGLLLIILALAFSPKYLSLGLDTIDANLAGTPASLADLVLKPVFTAITLSSGGSGGVLSPIFFLGTSAGSLFAQLFHLSLPMFAAIGLVAVLAGASNTPISASIMAIELFGPEIATYATTACVISFLVSGHRSIYPSQVFEMSKSTSIDVEKGHVAGQLHSRAKNRYIGMGGAFQGFMQTMEGQKKPLAEKRKKDKPRVAH